MQALIIGIWSRGVCRKMFIVRNPKELYFYILLTIIQALFRGLALTLQ